MDDGWTLPGGRHCIGCGGLTFRDREDQLCPRCAYEAEAMIEQIELDCLERDLTLITRFDAYYNERQRRRSAAATATSAYSDLSVRPPSSEPAPLAAPVQLSDVERARRRKAALDKRVALDRIEWTTGTPTGPDTGRPSWAPQTPGTPWVPNTRPA